MNSIAATTKQPRTRPITIPAPSRLIMPPGFRSFRVIDAILVACY